MVYLWQSFSSLYRLNRASQTYLFPIHLTDQILPSAVFYATVGPLAIYLAVQKLIIMPYVRAQKEQWVIIHNYCPETAHFPETRLYVTSVSLMMKGPGSLVVYRELEKQKEDSASEIARRKQEAEASVSKINT